MAKAFPAVLRTPIRPETVAQAVMVGIRRRAPRIIVLRRRVPVSLARGLVGTLTDRMLDGNTRFHALLRQREGQGGS